MLRPGPEGLIQTTTAQRARRGAHRVVRPAGVFAITLLLTLSLLRAQEYQLVWSDEFEGERVDPSKWEFQIGDGCDINLCGWGNNELEWYREENARLEDGHLIISAKRESFEGREFTSARLRTLGKADFQYGKIEARIRLPRGQGMWPAFWMLPSNSVFGAWAAGGEIDIMEAVNDMTEISGTIHFGGPWPKNQYTSTCYSEKKGDSATDFSADFHVYAVEWEPQQIRWFVDGKLYSARTEWFSTGGPFPAPFNQPFHLLLNLAVGGNLPKDPDATTVFPQEMRVDWVRVFQKPETSGRIREPEELGK